MTTTLDLYKQRAESQGGAAWIEELLIRGKPDGGIGGGHVVIGWRAMGIDGSTVGGLAAPFPLTVAADDPQFSQLCSLINAAAVDQIAALTAELATRTTERDSLAIQLTAAQETIAQLQQPA